MWHKSTALKVLAAPLLLQGDPGHVSGMQLPLGTGWGSRKSLSQGRQPRALEKSLVPAGGSRGRLPCFQHPCMEQAERVSHPTGRRGFARGKIEKEGWCSLHLEGNTFGGAFHSFHSFCSLFLHCCCPILFTTLFL